MPAFIAWRSPAWRIRQLELSSSGIGRRRPNRVSVYPTFRASITVRSMYALTFGNASK